MTLTRWMRKKIAAVSAPKMTKEKPLSTNPIPPLANDIPSNRLVIHKGLTLSMNNVAKPNVHTTIKDDFLCSMSSSFRVMT